MRIFITGVSCVGKTTVGEKLAALLGISFFDLDKEIEAYFGTSIGRLQNKFLTMYTFHQETSNALKSILSKKEGSNCVIVLSPGGLMDSYWRVVKNAKGIIIVLSDSPENILARITFYDIDSRQIQKLLTEKEKRRYLKEIKKDITYFGRTYERADITVDIEGCNPDEAAYKVKLALQSIVQKENK